MLDQPKALSFSIGIGIPENEAVRLSMEPYATGIVFSFDGIMIAA